jgi:PII-like signaling protein
VDGKDKIESFLPVLDGLVGEGLVTLEPAQIILYRAPQQPRGRG